MNNFIINIIDFNFRYLLFLTLYIFEKLMLNNKTSIKNFLFILKSFGFVTSLYKYFIFD